MNKKIKYGIYTEGGRRVMPNIMFSSWREAAQWRNEVFDEHDGKLSVLELRENEYQGLTHQIYDSPENNEEDYE